MITSFSAATSAISRDRCVFASWMSTIFMQMARTAKPD